MAEIWTVPGFTHVCELGAGDSGRVVQAVDDLTQTPVAIKYLDERLRRDERFQARFRAEARKLSQLEDPNVVQFFEYVEAPQASAIVMELVHGVTLARLLQTQGPIGPPAALVAFGGTLMGLAAVHGAGIVHGAYGPANVLIDESGNCKLADASVGVREGDGPANPAYLAPELWAGGPPSPAGDIYAATAAFFECLTGRPPFQGKNPAALGKAHGTEPVPVEAVPEPLRGLVLFGLAKDPAGRPASAEMFLGVLDDAAVATYGAAWETQGRGRLVELATKAAAAPLVTPSSPAAGAVPAAGGARPRRRRRRLLGAVLTVVVAGAVGVAGVYGMGIADGSGDTAPPGQSTTPAPGPASPPGGAVAGPPPSTPAALARAITTAAAARGTAAFGYHRDGGRGSATAARGVFSFAGEPASPYDMTVWSPVRGGRYTAKIRTVLVGSTAYVHGNDWNSVPATTRGGRTDAVHTYAALAAEARWSTSVQHVLALLRSTPAVRRSGLTYAGSATLSALARSDSVAPLYAQFTRAPRGTRITYVLKVDRDFLPLSLRVRITPPKGGKARPQALLVTYGSWGQKVTIAAPK